MGLKKPTIQKLYLFSSRSEEWNNTDQPSAIVYLRGLLVERMIMYFNPGIFDLAENGSGTTNDASEPSNGASEPVDDGMVSEKIP